MVGKEIFSGNESIDAPNEAICELCLWLYDITVIIEGFADIVCR